MSIRITENAFYSLEIGEREALRYRVGGGDGQEILFRWPEFEIDGHATGVPSGLRETGRRMRSEEIEEITLEGSLGGDLTLSMILRVCAKTPFIRFRYALSSSSPARMTKKAGEHLRYLSWSGAKDARRTEIRLSTYDLLFECFVR